MLTEGDAVLKNVPKSRGAKRGRRKPRGKATRKVVKMLKLAGIKNPRSHKGTWV